MAQPVCFKSYVQEINFTGMYSNIWYIKRYLGMFVYLLYAYWLLSYFIWRNYIFFFSKRSETATLEIVINHKMDNSTIFEKLIIMYFQNVLKPVLAVT